MAKANRPKIASVDSVIFQPEYGTSLASVTCRDGVLAMLYDQTAADLAQLKAEAAKWQSMR